MTAEPSLPLIRLDKVYHIGTLDPAQLGRNWGRSSQEGKCLSVSVCPYTWRVIARLGGYPLYRMTKATGEFVDMHAVADSGLLPRILDWAREECLVTDEVKFRVWLWDTECESWTSFLCETRAAAEEEIEFLGEEGADGLEGPDGRPAIEEVTVPLGTERLAEIIGRDFRPDEDATDFALLAWCMEKTAADGVWWRERHDPASLSAPRGGIFPSKLAEWDKVEVDFCSVNDEEELELFEVAAEAALPRAPQPLGWQA